LIREVLSESLRAALMKPANEDVLIERPVSKAINSVKNNSPELLGRD
jgi:putative SOS response-associated peptidase YedK